jgi:two-component system LytT family response regulator
LENKLDEAVFSRMNRTQIINRHFIDKVSTTLSGRLKITLKTGDVVEASERQSIKFRQMGRTQL